MITRTNKRRFSGLRAARKPFLAMALATTVLAGGCTTEQVLTNGPQLEQEQLDLVPVGSSRDQVLLALGTPSTTGAFDNEVFYYISQKRKRQLAYQKLKLVDQRVVAIYFDSEDIVERVADYQLQDGKIFDFISRTTPTGGKDITLLSRLFNPNASKNIKPAVPSLPGTGRF